MDGATLAVYERRAAEWIARRGEATDGLGTRLRALAGPGPVVDLGCGAGRYLVELGPVVVGVDGAAAMLALARRHGGPLARADLEALPFADGVLAGAFARHSYLHLEKARVPNALGQVRRALRPGAPFLLTVIRGSYEGHRLPDDDFAGRFFACWEPEELAAALSAAGFGDVHLEALARRRGAPDVLALARSPGS